MHMVLAVILSLQLTLLVSGYPYFQTKIPNGENVPHPCKPNYKWAGVGHINSRGGNERNDFGKAFKAAGEEWTYELCKSDTDNDGKTNGEELGDPNCTWKEGQPNPTGNLSHPGICDPWDSEFCKEHNWLDCDAEKDFKCDAFNEAGMRNITVRFPVTRVPPKETTYYCMVFDLPTDGDYHLVATTPHIDNRYLMHHILLYGCDTSQDDVSMPMNTPQQCGMGDRNCNRLISLWAIGFDGHCLHNNIGMRIGTHGFKKAMFQFHYNNPELRSDYIDSSGMNLFFTPNRRQYDAGILMVGQLFMEIFPEKEHVEVTGTCSSDCTDFQLSGSVKVTEAANHMHYLGRAMKIEQYRRDGSKIRTITDERVYSYENPISYDFQEPFQLDRGDELKVTCVFASKTKNRTTFYGDATSDEMCYGFLTYYPAQNIQSPFCYSWLSLPTCKLWNADRFPVLQGCNMKEVYNPLSEYSRNMSEEVMRSCVPFGRCYPECLKEVKRLKSHPCMSGDMGRFFRNQVKRSNDPNVLKYYAAHDSCLAERDAVPCICETCPGVSGASYHVVSAASLFLILVVSLLWLHN